MSGSGAVVVCVTGASGFIASWLVKKLLQRGYTVKGTVLNLNDPSMTRHLISLAGAKERLHLFEANLNEDGSFDPVVDGCEGVFHTASPVLLSPGDPKADLLDPAVKGTLNVLRSCAKVPSIKRVVLTSSMTAICPSKKPLDPGAIIDETWFSDPVFLEESKEWYQLSKTLAEQAAWKFARENGIDLVTIHPGIVIGPLLQPTLNASTGEILNLIKKGNEVSSDAFFRFVDVRDVAYAHIQAFEIPSASGRYGLVGRVTYASEALSILHRSFPTLNLPKRNEDEKSRAPPFQVSKERAESLGINFTPVEVSLKDTVESLKQNNFLNF